jgi:hypothetical protein
MRSCPSLRFDVYCVVVLCRVHIVIVMNTFLFLIFFFLSSDTPNSNTNAYANTNVHTNLEILLCDCDSTKRLLSISTMPSTGEGKFSELFGSRDEKSIPEMLDIQVQFYEINIQSYDRRFQWNISKSFYDLQSHLRSMAKYSPHAWISVKFEIPPYGNLVHMANDQDYQRGIQSSAERHNWRILSGRHPNRSDHKNDLNLHVWIEEFHNLNFF